MPEINIGRFQRSGMRCLRGVWTSQLPGSAGYNRRPSHCAEGDFVNLQQEDLDYIKDHLAEWLAERS